MSMTTRFTLYISDFGDNVDFVTQLFDYCLSPDTTGDGTGCDNMTAVIVQFKKDGAEATKVNGNGSAAASAEKELTQQSSKRKESEGKDGAKASEEPESKKAKL